MTLRWNPFPAAEDYRVLGTPVFGGQFVLQTNGSSLGHSWREDSFPSNRFYRLEVTPLASNALLTASVLNRLAYGPTPDDLERVSTIGPQAYIDEQLAPEGILETLDTTTTESAGGTNWIYATVSGSNTSSTLYIYLSSAGEALIDDLQLVPGSVAGAGPNRIVNGDFETTLSPAWQLSSNFSGSAIESVAHSGSGALRIRALAAGSSSGNSISQTITGLTNGVYTLSYWYVPSGNRSLIVRLSGSSLGGTGIHSAPDSQPSALHRKLANGQATMSDLRAWYCLHAVRGKRQLLGIQSQFLENHFVTQYSKSRDYFDRYYDDFNYMGIVATDLEFREIGQWQSALLNPGCTFYDLLKISAESPAMIIYLDTVTSRGDGSNIANENYARELLELFTFGADNGYDQTDITVMSRAWTGWTVRYVDQVDSTNRFALQSTNTLPGITYTNGTAISNLVGVWSFVFRPERHNNSSKTIFAGKVVPPRFGTPYSTKTYRVGMPPGRYDLLLPARSGTSGIQDGYDIIQHLADLPFTQEYLSVKLCRLFVHDDFEPGYDFTDPNLSPEGQLVRQCMAAWENGTPKGQVREVLRTIFNSDLFRSHGGSLQKVKTPLEFAASTIRALRSVDSNGSATAETDGYAFSSPLGQMGSMALFDRGDPDGYPETAPGWVSAGTLAERLRFIQSALMPSGSGGKENVNNVTDPVALLRKKLPPTAWGNAGLVADYFLSILYPAEGKANLDEYRQISINFLNNGTVDSPASPAPFSTSLTAANYDTRVRGMVSMLMTLQRFQEQ